MFKISIDENIQQESSYPSRTSSDQWITLAKVEKIASQQTALSSFRSEFFNVGNYNTKIFMIFFAQELALNGLCRNDPALRSTQLAAILTLSLRYIILLFIVDNVLHGSIHTQARALSLSH